MSRVARPRGRTSGSRGRIAAKGGCPIRIECTTLPHMNRIGVRQLQQNAAAAVKRVRHGEQIEVTDRGRPVAMLVPIAARNVLDALEAAGRLARAEGDLLELGAPIRRVRKVAAPSRRLARMRAAER